MPFFGQQRIMGAFFYNTPLIHHHNTIHGFNRRQNRPKAEIDDIVAFFDNKAGVTAFNYTYPDSNAGGGERTIKVVCETYNQNYSNNDFYSCTAIFRRVYEA